MHTRVHHMLEHPEICDWGTCQFCCATLEDLTKHMRFHTGEQPYKCTEDGCLYASANNTNAGALKVRKGSHTGEHP